MMKYPDITSAFLNVTNACNLACRYCFVEQHPEFMPLSVAKDAAAFLFKNSTGGRPPSITFFGGEPMLCWESVVRPLIAHIRETYGEGYALSMTTNGTLLTEDILDFLQKNQVSVMVSIDGDRATQDYNRPFHDGSGSHDVLSRILPAYLARNPSAVFRSTLIPATAEHLASSVAYAERLGFRSFFVIPNVFEPWDDGSRRTVEGETRKVSDRMIAAFAAGRRPMTFSTLEESLQRIVQINRRAGCANCTGAEQKCGLGTGPFASIDWRGRLYACQEMASCKGEGDPFYIGDIYAGPDRARREALAARWTPGGITGDGCGDCLLRAVCDGGCAANNYMAMGSVTAVPPAYCWWLRLMLREAVYLMERLGDPAAPGHRAFRAYWMELQGRKGFRCRNMMC